MVYFTVIFILILVSYFYIIYAYSHYSNKYDVINNIIGYMALFTVFFHILLLEILMYQDFTLHLDLVPGFLFGFGFPIAINFLLIL